MNDPSTKAIAAAVASFTAAAVIKELRRPSYRRGWNGRLLGIPYDFRRPSLKRVRRSWWSPNDSRLMTPRAFGIGWDFNVGRMWRLVRGR